MRFYGLPPSELALLKPRDVAALRLNMVRIAARERLQFIVDIGQAFPGKDGSQKYIGTLIHQAYGDNPDEHAVILEALTRYSHGS